MYLLSKKAILFSFMFLFVIALNAQSLKRKVADKYFSEFEYSKAVELYEEMATSKKKDSMVVKRTAECYRLMGDSEKSEIWYNELIQIDINPKNYYYYSQALKMNGKYNLSDDNMKIYYTKTGQENKILTEEDYLKLKKDSANFSVAIIPLNSPESDFSPIVVDNELVFTSNRRPSVVRKKTVSWDNTYFLDVYKYKLDNSENEASNYFNKDLTKNSHDGPVWYDKTNSRYYITRSNNSKGSDKKKLKLYIIEKNDGVLKEAESFTYNNDDYSVGHATLTADGKTMYFISDMPGGFGETDIWRTTLVDGAWSKPENLGNEINTSDKEMFPFISSDGDLYFSSIGHPGLGGLDVFKAFKDENKFMNPINVGYPINTHFDDFSFFLTNNGTEGYFASNRIGGIGRDDIYKVNILKPIEKEEAKWDYFVKGNVFDDETKALLAGTKVTLRNKSTNADISILIEAKGYEFKLDKNTDYILFYEKKGYIASEQNISTKNKDSGNLELNGNLRVVVDGNLEPAGIEINNIYYEYNKYSLTSGTKKELDELIQLLVQYKEMKIELSAYTDSRGPSGFNQTLSNKRAKSAYNYLIAKGINKSRLNYKGFGESKLVNKCMDGIECSEDEHAKNRRTEFRITK